MQRCRSEADIEKYLGETKFCQFKAVAIYHYFSYTLGCGNVLDTHTHNVHNTTKTKIKIKSTMRKNNRYFNFSFVTYISLLCKLQRHCT